MADKRWPKRVVNIRTKAVLGVESRTTNEQLLSDALEAFAEEYHVLYERHKALREAIEDARFNSDSYDSDLTLKRALEADDAKDAP